VIANEPIENNWVLAENANIGDSYQDGQFVPASSDTVMEAQFARLRRNALLVDSDWTQLADAPVDQDAWKNYRQVLRNIPNQPGFPTNIDWPTKP
jgi:hypothetical protein